MDATVSTYGDRDFEVVFEGRQVAVFKTRKLFRRDAKGREELLPPTEEDRGSARRLAERFASMLNGPSDADGGWLPDDIRASIPAYLLKPIDAAFAKQRASVLHEAAIIAETCEVDETTTRFPVERCRKNTAKAIRGTISLRPGRTVTQIEAELAQARERHRREGPRHEHVEACERLFAELNAALATVARLPPCHGEDELRP